VAKRRFTAEQGVFVPNVSDDTIDFMVASGQWTPVPDEKPKKAAPKAKSED
jgi:hypothetical protein